MPYWVLYLAVALAAWAFQRPGPALLVALALAAVQLGRWLRARRELALELAERRAYALEHPGDLRARRELAERLLEAKRPAEAAWWMTEGIAKGLDDAESFHLLGLARLRCGEAEPALRALVRAIQLAPRIHQGEGLFHCAHALESLGRAEEAITAYEEGLEVQRTALEQRWRLAQLRRRAGDREGALADAREVLRVWRELPPYLRGPALRCYLRALVAVRAW